MNLEERVTELERRLNERDEIGDTQDLMINTYVSGNKTTYRIVNLVTGKEATGTYKPELIREVRRA